MPETVALGNHPGQMRRMSAIGGELKKGLQL
jgi:hypothetical protein